ncbi:MAG TPA: SAM-dependent methyltransferase, partial [Gammaproteobacteria bacterium]|nr:SAM-dependent methyltransferase [Gammaproteobacteria bacterium]MCH77554.1 SAM-dependent methyltransferase [Gammaproteobacteria bacterium]
AASQAGFEVGSLGVAQVQLATDVSAVPLTRDYLYRSRSAPAVLRRVG